MPADAENTYGEWVVVSRKFIRNIKTGVVTVSVRCSCGVHKSIAWSRLRAGNSRSCRACCARISWKKKLKRLFGRTPDAHDKRLSIMWLNIMSRCLSPKNPRYNSYGARGIHVSTEFRNRVCFVNYCRTLDGFNAPNVSIDRIDNNAGYERGNLRFTTQRIQNRNKSSNRWVNFRGNRLVVVDFWKEFCPHLSDPSAVRKALLRGLTPTQVIAIKPRTRRTKVTK